MPMTSGRDDTSIGARSSVPFGAGLDAPIVVSVSRGWLFSHVPDRCAVGKLVHRLHHFNLSKNAPIDTSVDWWHESLALQSTIPETAIILKPTNAKNNVLI